LFILAPPPKNFVVKERRSSLVKAASTQAFYTENKNETGMSFDNNKQVMIGFTI